MKCKLSTLLVITLLLVSTASIMTAIMPVKAVTTEDCDLEKDHKIDTQDVAWVGFALGTWNETIAIPADPNYNLTSDIDKDGQIDIADVAWIGYHFDDTY